MLLALKYYLEAPRGRSVLGYPNFIGPRWEPEPRARMILIEDVKSRAKEEKQAHSPSEKQPDRRKETECYHV